MITPEEKNNLISEQEQSVQSGQPENQASAPEETEELFQYQTGKKSSDKKKKVHSGMLHKFLPAIVLGCAAIVLTGVYITLRLIAPNETDEQEQVNKVAVTDFAATDVKSVYVLNEQDEYTLYKKSGSVYKIKGKEDKDSSSTYISTAIEKLSAISSIKQIEVSNEKLDEYGLKNPKGRAEIEGSSEKTTLYLGNQSADEDYYYMLKLDDENSEEGKSTVYLVEAGTAELLSKTRLYYYNQDISGYDANSDNENISPVIVGGNRATAVSIKSMQTESSDQEENVSLTFMMYEPISMPFSTTVMDSFLSLLTTLNECTAVSDDVSAQNLAKLGLDNPDYTFHFGNNTFEKTILFGKTDGDSIYCMQKGGGIIYTIAKSAVSCLSLGLSDMCDVITYTRDVDTVEEIRLTGNQKTYDIKLVGKDDELMVYVNNKNVNRSVFSEFYAGILGIEVQKEGEKPSDTPYVTMELTLSDGGKEYLRYYAVDDRYCYYELNGTGMFYVSRQAVDSLLTNAQKLYDNEEIVLAW